MEKNKHFSIHIASDKDMNQAFINTWKKAQQEKMCLGIKSIRKSTWPHDQGETAPKN